MKRARGRPSINLNKRRLKAAWYYRGRQGWEDPTGRALFDPDRSWLYVVARDHSQGYRSAPAVFEEGRQYIGGVPFPAGDAAGGANRNFVLATDTTTGEGMWKYPIVRGSFAAVVLRTGGGIVFAATAAGDLGRSRFWIGQAALVFPNRSYDRFFSNKRFGRRKAVCGDCPAAGARRCTEQVEHRTMRKQRSPSVIWRSTLRQSECQFR